MKIEKFRGGVFDTNAFMLETTAGRILVDAPEGADQWVTRQGWQIALLLLTHAHFDHVIDAAKIRARHSCPVAAHPEGLPLLQDSGVYRSLGFELEIEPVELDQPVEEGPADFLGEKFEVLYVPGHCPGSLCFFHLASRELLGGDVLFAGGVGRWDLPGGNYEILMSGIKNKVLPLGDDVVVHPGHGPSFRIGQERKSNPYLI